VGEWLPILVYHSVSDRVAPAFRQFSISPSLFREHLAVLAQEGYRTQTVTAAAAGIRDGCGVGDRTVVLTFDDAFADFAENALPALRAADCAATLYVPTAYVASPRVWLSREGVKNEPVMGWDELREAADAGIEIGAHSHTHAELDLLTGEALTAEIAQPKALLEDHLGHEVTTFAYPFGAHCARVRRDVRAAGYRSACAVGNLTAGVRSDVWSLPRLAITETTDADELLRLLSLRPTSGERLLSEAKRVMRRTQRRWLTPASR
jgi:peptidoglycan/xylan/chitin deacetylase (PgdA/CDA1 family)